MKKGIIFFLFLSVINIQAEVLDSIKLHTEVEKFIGVNLGGGVMLPTNDFVKKSDVGGFGAATIKYGYHSAAYSWTDKVFGMPYWGVGLSFSYFPCHESLGYPFTPFLFQGATLYNFNEKVSFNYEWNLGMSFNWNPYDPFDNRSNIAIGTSTNVYVAFFPYINFPIAEGSDLKVGVGFSHFSNGSTKKPNKGLNLFSSFVEYDHDLGERKNVQPVKYHAGSTFNPYWDLDLMLTISSRQLEFDTVGTGLKSRYVDKSFPIMALSVAPMYVKNYRYKYGFGFDFMYDGSVNSEAWREYNVYDDTMYDRVKLGPFWDRFLAGVAAKGELTMPYYSILGSMGYNYLQKDKAISRLYQIIAIKIYLKENLYGSFGIRATRFSRAQCLYWSIGYTLGKKRVCEIRKEEEKILQMF